MIADLAVLIVGGYNEDNANREDRGNLRTVDLIQGKGLESECKIENLPRALGFGSLVKRPGNNEVLFCGGSDGLNGYDQCYQLQGNIWKEHSHMTTERNERMQVTMPDGVYIFGTKNGKTTSDYLPRHSITLATIPKVSFCHQMLVQFHKLELV